MEILELKLRAAMTCGQNLENKRVDRILVSHRIYRLRLDRDEFIAMPRQGWMSHASVEIVFHHRDTDRCSQRAKAPAFPLRRVRLKAVPFPCRPLTLAHLNPIR